MLLEGMKKLAKEQWVFRSLNLADELLLGHIGYKADNDAVLQAKRSVACSWRAFTATE